MISQINSYVIVIAFDRSQFCLLQILSLVISPYRHVTLFVSLLWRTERFDTTFSVKPVLDVLQFHLLTLNVLVGEAIIIAAALTGFSPCPIRLNHA